jgi:hypothetical protein
MIAAFAAVFTNLDSVLPGLVDPEQPLEDKIKFSEAGFKL